jgi:hypothetical protein
LFPFGEEWRDKEIDELWLIEGCSNGIGKREYRIVQNKKILVLKS